MSAQKEEAKQRKRKSLKMALEKCMQRREAATTTNNTTTTTTNTNMMNTSLAMSTFTSSLSSTITTTVANLSTTTSRDMLSPEVSFNLLANKGPEVTSTPQKLAKDYSTHEMEILETTETETSLDTSAEVNASDMCESREEEDLESETSINSTTAKETTPQQQQQQEVKIMEQYDDKPLDFTKSPTKKLQNDDNEAKDVEEYLKSTAVIKEIITPSKDNDNEQVKDNDLKNAASLKEN